MSDIINKVAASLIKDYTQDESLQRWLGDKSIFSKAIESFAEDSGEKPYKLNVWVFVAIEAIRRNIASIPKMLYDTRTDTVIDKHPVLDLFKRPNPDTFGTGLWDQIVVNMLLTGQTWLLPGAKENLGKGIIPKELYHTQDRWMEAKVESGKIVHWLYRPQGKDIVYKKDELIRLNFYNPYDQLKGLAPLDAAYIAIQLYGKIGSFNANFFKNNAALGGILELPKAINEKAVERIEKEFNSAHAGESNAGKVTILNGMKWQSTSSTHKDMSYEKQYEFTKEEILSAFGVPKNQIGDFADQNYSNAVEANRSFWEDCLLPKDAAINEAITWQFIKGINPDWELRSNYNSVEAINNIPKEKIEAFEKLVKNGVPKKEACRLLNIPVDWKAVDSEEKEQEAKDEKKRQIEDARIAAQQQQQDSKEDDDINLEEDEKSLKSSLNSFFTKLRNECMDRVDKNESPNFDIDKEYNSLTDSLKSAVWLPLIKNYIEASKLVNGDIKIEAIEIVRLLNGRSKAFKEVLEGLNKGLTNNKTEIQELFKAQYASNKEIAKTEVKALYSQIVRL